jgi:hypothetical protein
MVFIRVHVSDKGDSATWPGDRGSGLDTAFTLVNVPPSMFRAVNSLLSGFIPNDWLCGATPDR